MGRLAQRTTAENHGAPRNPAEPHGTLKRDDRALKSTYFSRVSHILFFSFSSLLASLSQHLMLRQKEGLSKPRHVRSWGWRWMGETTHDGRTAAEYASHRTGHWGDWHNQQPRNPTGPHGAPRNPHGTVKRPDYAPKSIFFSARFPHFRLLVFFSPLLPLPTPDVATNGRPFETTDMFGAGR